MSEEQNGNKRRFIEISGLVWIPILIYESKFNKHPKPKVDRINEIKDSAAKLGEESVEFVLQQYEKLINDEETRRKEIDAKASSIIGFSGIFSGIILGLTPLLINANSLSLTVKIIISTLYFLIGCSLIIAILLAQKSIEIGRDAYMSPVPSDLLSMEKGEDLIIKRTLAGDLLRSFEYNLPIINDKASIARGAQDWFRNTVFFVFIMIVLIAVSLNFQFIEEPQQPYEVIIISTQTPLDPTQIISITPTLPSITPTIAPHTLTIQPTLSISATLQKTKTP